MDLLARLRTRWNERRRGVLAAPDTQEVEDNGLPRIVETAGTRRLERPEPTPSMHVRGFGGTAGTPDYRNPSGTPSTQRIHNPSHPGR